MDVNQEIHEIKETESKIWSALGHSSKLNHRIKVGLCIFIILLIGFIAFREVNHDNQLINQLKVSTEMDGRFNWSDMPESERKEKHRKFMMRIFNVYGYKYYPHKKKAF